MTLQPLLSLHISYTCSFFFIFFFFNDTPTTEIYTLSLHDALPISLAVYRVTKRFPADERYGLTSQTRRAAFSAAVNIVEGSSRRSAKEFRRFLDISLSSLTEVWVRVAVLTRSRFARGRGLVDPERPPEPRAV